MPSKKNKARSAREANPRRFKTKSSVIATEKVEYVDYKDVDLLRRFMSDRSKVKNRRVAGRDLAQQREVANAIKVAREMALLPYAARVASTHTGGRRAEEQNVIDEQRTEQQALALTAPTSPRRDRVTADVSELTGLPVEAARRLLDDATLSSVDADQDRVEAARARVLELLTPDIEDLDHIPLATIQQAQQLASLRTDLLKSGSLTVPQLGEIWTISDVKAKDVVEDLIAAHKILTVNVGEAVVVPTFLLAADFSPRDECTGAIEILRGAGENEWAIWAWLVSPSPWLDGDRPADLAAQDPTRVRSAAIQRVSNTAA